MEPSLHQAYQALAGRFAAHFPTQLDGPRTVGREAEFPVVDQSGRAADIDRLWPLLLAEETGEGSSLSPFKVKRDAVNPDLIVGLDGAAYSYALEVGKGTIELNVGPYTTLFELESAFRSAVERLVRAAAQLGWRVLGYGVQPLSPPARALLSPKQRYHALADIMGDDWIWYTVTASDQTHVDVSRDEAVSVLNFAILMAPVVVALCANSPVVAGALTGDCSGREGRMINALYGERHGIIARPYADLTDFVARLSRVTSLLRREGERLLPDGRPFSEVLRTDYRATSEEWTLAPLSSSLSPDAFDAFLLHDHYIWHSARLRTAYGTVELRPACQQPPHELMAATALYLGLVEGREQITDYMQTALAPTGEERGNPDPLAECWPRMQQYHELVVRAGLAAPEPVPGFLADILELVAAALTRRGYGEERMLAPLWQRLEQKENPAQRVRRVFTKEGLEGLIEFSNLENYVKERPRPLSAPDS
ncbi:MAG: glutamate-cysteine ligase family protein [Caldilineaceae bacterium]|nr:glutamate-cysteine ligase family protein [Caldilineaceae bacterium]MDE0336168.1 glutamate-cysteine ligase family protein [Caldilineaceae bacterium]